MIPSNGKAMAGNARPNMLAGERSGRRRRVFLGSGQGKCRRQCQFSIVFKVVRRSGACSSVAIEVSDLVVCSVTEVNAAGEANSEKFTGFSTVPVFRRKVDVRFRARIQCKVGDLNSVEQLNPANYLSGHQQTRADVYPFRIAPKYE